MGLRNSIRLNLQLFVLISLQGAGGECTFSPVKAVLTPSLDNASLAKRKLNLQNKAGTHNHSYGMPF